MQRAIPYPNRVYQQPYANYGKVDNKGIDLSLNYKANQ